MHPLFVSATRPNRAHLPTLDQYESGMYFDSHVDAKYAANERKPTSPRQPHANHQEGNLLIQGINKNRLNCHFWHDAAINGKILIQCDFNERSSINTL